MNLIEGIEQNCLIDNTKNSKYYITSYNNNLDLFAMVSRFNPEEDILRIFNNALEENKDLALANLLYILDIRNGKGERRIFKIIFKDLCINSPKYAMTILPFIEELGRYDYILEGLNTPLENEVLEIIKKQIKEDQKTNYPSLLAKWLPSIRTHNKTNKTTKYLIKKLNITEKEYRKILSTLRTKINIVEKNITNKSYNDIELSKVPAKAMLKYKNLFQAKMTDTFEEYMQNVKEGKSKINTKGLYSYEIIKNILDKNKNIDANLYDLMWNNQKDILNGCDSNVLVVADTSASMLAYNKIPYSTALGLALYTAQRNKGIFKDYFITFSKHPQLQKVIGKTIREKINNIRTIVSNTNIDKVFELILTTAVKNNINQEELPSHLIIISDMEFDSSVETKDTTNFTHWKNSFQEKGYELPKIIFWNVAGNTRGIPTTKYDNDVCMINGFSTNALENILTLENLTPEEAMMDRLNKYLEMLKNK